MWANARRRSTAALHHERITMTDLVPLRPPLRRRDFHIAGSSINSGSSRSALCSCTHPSLRTTLYCSLLRCLPISLFVVESSDAFNPRIPSTTLATSSSPLLHLHLQPSSCPPRLLFLTFAPLHQARRFTSYVHIIEDHCACLHGCCLLCRRRATPAQRPEPAGWTE